MIRFSKSLSEVPKRVAKRYEVGVWLAAVVVEVDVEVVRKAVVVFILVVVTGPSGFSPTEPLRDASRPTRIATSRVSASTN